jgi:hypothetical protein
VKDVRIEVVITSVGTLFSEVGTVFHPEHADLLRRQYRNLGRNTTKIIDEKDEYIAVLQAKLECFQLSIPEQKNTRPPFPFVPYDVVAEIPRRSQGYQQGWTRVSGEHSTGIADQAIAQGKLRCIESGSLAVAMKQVFDCMADRQSKYEFNKKHMKLLIEARDTYMDKINEDRMKMLKTEGDLTKIVDRLR